MIVGMALVVLCAGLRIYKVGDRTLRMHFCVRPWLLFAGLASLYGLQQVVGV